MSQSNGQKSACPASQVARLPDFERDLNLARISKLARIQMSLYAKFRFLALLCLAGQLCKTMADSQP